jgi:hypothetical protein
MKRFWVILTLILLLLPSITTRAETAGSGILITELMTGTTNSANAEFVELHNQSNQDINISAWKLLYYSATGSSASTKVTFSGTVSSHGFVLLGTEEFKTEYGLSSADFTFNPGFSDAGGRLKLVDGNGTTIDAISWGANSIVSEGSPTPSLTRGSSVKRAVNTDANFIDENNNDTDFIISTSPYPQGGDVYEPEVVSPPVEPSGETETEAGASLLTISELLPNVSGSDTGNEFIEIYNPNEKTVALAGYLLQIGPNFETSVNLPNEIEILPHQYLALYNNYPTFTLVNTSSRAKLLAPAGNEVSETPLYDNLKESESWALFEDGWHRTMKPTPNEENSLVTESADLSNIETGLEPCAPGKYRNPETNRCKIIEDSDVVTCSAGQERNPETNRCRKVTSSELSPCKEGYERNQATNRCRKSGTDEDMLTPCHPGYERNPSTNRCRKTVSTGDAKLAAVNQASAINPISLSTRIVLVLLVVALGYGVYEYRNDLRNLIGKLKTRTK